MSSYLKLPWTFVLICHSYTVFLAARSAKDSVLQAIASGGMLCAFILMLVILLHRHYRHTAIFLTIFVWLMLCSLYLKTASCVAIFWLLLVTGFALVQPIYRFWLHKS